MHPDPAESPRCAVLLAAPELAERAACLAHRLDLPLLNKNGTEYEILVAFTPRRLELRFPQPGGPKPLFVDFVGGPLGYARRRNRFGLLFDAVGFKTGRPTVLDATAGLGADAFRLAWHGCRVTAVERNPILAALLRDGVERALREPEIAARIDDRLQIVQGDARQVLAALAPEDAPDVVYIDPMYPPRRKAALNKVEMRILRQLVGDDPDAAELLAVARRIARRRVVVKRPRHADPLTESPSHSHRDTSTRYDVYMTLQPAGVAPESAAGE